MLDNESKEYLYSRMEEQEKKDKEEEPEKEETTGYRVFGTIAKVFMIIACVVKGFYIIPLIWIIPMTVKLSKKLQNKEPIGIGFKICTFLFVNFIAGIALFCVNNDELKEI